MRALGVDPVADTRDTFRTLLAATSRPGTVQSVPATPADRAVLSTLVDQEVTLHTTADPVVDALRAAGRYAPAPPGEADVVHFDGPSDGTVRATKRGSLERPHRGATVVYRVDDLSAAAGARPVTVHVSGPGVDGTRTFSVGGLPTAELRAIAAHQADYPRGVDCLLTAADDVVGLPRSVDLEVD